MSGTISPLRLAQRFGQGQPTLKDQVVEGLRLPTDAPATLPGSLNKLTVKLRDLALQLTDQNTPLE